MFNAISVSCIHKEMGISQVSNISNLLSHFVTQGWKVCKTLISTEKTLWCKIIVWDSQGIIQKKSASGSRTLPLVIFNITKKFPFFPKVVLFKAFWVTLWKKCPFFEDSGRCPKILDYTLTVKKMRDHMCVDKKSDSGALRAFSNLLMASW